MSSNNFACLLPSGIQTYGGLSSFIAIFYKSTKREWSWNSLPDLDVFKVRLNRHLVDEFVDHFFVLGLGRGQKFLKNLYISSVEYLFSVSERYWQYTFINECSFKIKVNGTCRNRQWNGGPLLKSKGASVLLPSRSFLPILHKIHWLIGIIRTIHRIWLHLSGLSTFKMLNRICNCCYILVQLYVWKNNVKQ